MGKIVGLLLVVLGIWVGLEVYSNGVDGAFGGALASVAPGEASRDPGTAPQRAGAAVQKAHDEAEARTERLLAQ